MKSPTYSFMEVDIETLSTRDDAAILQIAALHIPAELVIDLPSKLDSDKVPSFNEFIKPEGFVSQDTLEFIEKNAIEILAEAESNGMLTKAALKRFINFYESWNPDFVFARSPSFDLAVLRKACERNFIEYPIPFWKERCSRTYCDGKKYMIKDVGMHVERSEAFQPAHDARSDVKYQAWCHIVYNYLTDR